MLTSLRREIVKPHRIFVRHLIAVGLGCGLMGAGTALVVAAMSEEPRHELALAPAASTELPPSTVPVAVPMVIVTEPPAPEPWRASELAFVFRAGGATYMKLADLANEANGSETAEARPRHAAMKLLRSEGEEVAVGNVADRDVPLAHRSWKGKTVVVEGGCKTQVTGFAVVSRLTGGPGYAGLLDADGWTAKQVLSHGSAVLAARLAGCDQGDYARDATLGSAIELEPLDNPALVASATQVLLASEPARKTQLEWDSAQAEGKWTDRAEIASKVLRHPGTGETWVSVHAKVEGGCGDANANVWGLFRVDDEGKLIATQLRQLGDLHAIEKLIDVDGDGEPELLGRPWIGLDHVLTRASGQELDRLSLVFYGCPC